MFNLFKKKSEEPLSIVSPVAGTLKRLEEVPDPVFSQKMMGEGFAVEPEDGHYVSPVEGEVTLVPETAHAIGIVAHNGAEILVHVGVDTVELGGEGFTARVQVGDEVKVGDPIVDVDLAQVGPKVKSLMTPVLVTNSDAYEMEPVNLSAGKGEAVLVLRRKEK